MDDSSFFVSVDHYGVQTKVDQQMYDKLISEDPHTDYWIVTLDETGQVIDLY